MDIKCIKASGSGKAEEFLCVIWEVFPRSQHYYSITEDKDKVCACKLALSLLWIKNPATR